jgi:hypothetical protein
MLVRHRMPRRNNTVHLAPNRDRFPSDRRLVRSHVRLHVRNLDPLPGLNRDQRLVRNLDPLPGLNRDQCLVRNLDRLPGLNLDPHLARNLDPLPALNHVLRRKGIRAAASIITNRFLTVAAQ